MKDATYCSISWISQLPCSIDAGPVLDPAVHWCLPVDKDRARPSSAPCIGTAVRCKPVSISLDALQVRVGVVKRSKKVKAPMPQELSARRPAIARKLNITCDWKEDSTAHDNYDTTGFCNDPNRKISGLQATTEANDVQGAPSVLLLLPVRRFQACLSASGQRRHAHWARTLS